MRCSKATESSAAPCGHGSTTDALRAHAPQCHGQSAAAAGWKNTGMQPSVTASSTPLRDGESPPGCRQKVERA